ncbi:T-lymphocyte activation antigen CD80 [Cebidichthys violaceus]|uniref:T-lymphocyte activation antigen CD80 n=1 Tax=Cebidichthys violaceus TaxID=271503 RepID=UPI0035CC250C
MRTFLGVLMVVIVSGDVTTIRGFLEDSVLLPCNCSELDKEFKWQMEEPTKMVMLIYNKTLSNRYEGRTKTFLSEDSNNCSVLLNNITAEDQGKYRCLFHREEKYTYNEVYLNVNANYSVCQTEESLSGGVKVFRCNVSGSYREAWIQWTLDGQLLTYSTTTNITHTNYTDAGLYHFNSTLSTKLNWTSEPTCDVKAKNISTTLNRDCGGPEPYQNPRPQAVDFMRNHFMIILSVLLLGLFSLLLLYFSKRLQRKQEVNTSKHTTNSNVTI